MGKLRLRRGIPKAYLNSAVLGERRFYTEVLKRALGADSREAELYQEVVDIGCRNWSYAQSLAAFFPKAKLTGIEVDGGRRYVNLYCRRDQARAYAHELCQKGREAWYWEGDYLDFDPHSVATPAVFTFFYPFVSDNPCLKWGLPVQFADFYKLLLHTKELVKKSQKNVKGDGEGLIVSLHQGEWEAIEARKHYTKENLSVKEFYIPSAEFKDFWPSPYDAYGFLAKV